LLKRTHGGAVTLRPLVDPALDARAVLNLDAKRAIAEACLDYIADADSIFLDSGTTLLELARLLGTTDPLAPRRFRALTVLTNGLDAAAALASAPGIEHVLLGGTIRPVMGAVVGALAVQNLQRFSVGPAFLGISGLSETGITVADLTEAALKEVVLDRARRVIVPIDSSKVGLTDFARVGGLEDVDVVVTEAVSDQLEHLCATYDIELRVAATAPHRSVPSSTAAGSAAGRAARS
jgi:DeoR/GlpR family transcriptional regulator of sugar metabolism